MSDELDEESKDWSIQDNDLLYPFAVILFMMSFFDLTGLLTSITVVSTPISMIITEIFNLTQTSYESVKIILRLGINLIAQTGFIISFLFLHKKEKLEPEEKDMPVGNHIFTTYLVYSLLMVFALSTLIIDFILETLGLPTVSPYSGIAPNLELLGIPIYYILFFAVLVVGAAVGEELVFRRAFIPYLERRGLGTFWVLLFSSLLFSLMHTPADLLSGSIRFAIVHFLNTFAGGFALGFLYMRTRKIIFPIILHGLVNGVAAIGQIGDVRWNELNEYTLLGLGGLWLLTALIIGGGTVVLVVIQIIRYRNSPEPPVWLLILSDFNLRSSRLLPVSLIAAGFIGITAGLPILFDFFFQLFGLQNSELAIIRYVFETVYLILLIILLAYFIFRRSGPLKKPDWVSDTKFPEKVGPSYPTPTIGLQINLCGSCGREIIPQTKFCVYCGEMIVNTCVSCGNEIVPNTEFCVYCGTKV
ncbi:MAG: CPBP family intramembrane metalloprotease [Candidatus Heimdallarchaeota archaeon]|nr:MAG: CPBP family intramembrane metalloprotease [Candidatus Heimdallarchaeota archaeon]